MVEQGMAKYSARAFKQDSAAAMRGEIERGLIELITNADDAYGNSSGEIHIKIKQGGKRFPVEVSVSDSAKGLSYTELKNAFTEIGAMTSGLANGRITRGMLGRGAKDVASFGAIRFEAIKDGRYSELTLFQDSSYVSEFSNIEASSDHYKALGLGKSQNGLTATILCSKPENIRNLAELTRRLGSVAQLRDLISRRKVTIEDFRTSGPTQQIRNWLPQGVELASIELDLDGYDGTALLNLRKLQELQPSNVSEWSANGILIKSGISVFQNTWFSSSLSKRYAARILTGEVIVPQISDILKSELFAQKDNDEFSEIQLLSRTRDGLEKNHPLWKALVKAVEVAVHDIFEELEEIVTSGQKQGVNLSRDFNLAATALSPDVAEILKDLDDELPENEIGSALNKLDVIPRIVTVPPNSTFTLSVRADDALTSKGVKIAESGSLLGIEFLSGRFGEPFLPDWKEHSRLENKFVIPLQFKSPERKGVYFIDFMVGDELCTTQVIVGERTPLRKPQPEILEFSPNVVYSSPGRGKNLLLRAPIEMTDCEINIQISGVPGSLSTPSVTLRAEPEGQWAQAFVHIKTSQNLGNIEVQAHFGDELASAQIKVEEASNGSGKNARLSFELNGDENPIFRFDVSPVGVGAYKVVVFGKHKLFNNVFGEFVGDAEGFRNEDSPTARAILAQVIAQAFAQQLVELAFDKKPEDKWDAASTMFRFNEYFEKFVGTLHKALVK